MQKKINILIATGLYPPEIGGPATYSFFLEKELTKRDFNVFIVKFSDARHLPKIIRHLYYFWLVFKKSGKCDIIYAQDPLSVGLPSLLASKIRRKPFMVHVAGDCAWEQSYQRFGVTDLIDEFQNKKYGFRVELFRSLQSFVVKYSTFTITPSLYFKRLVSNWIPKKNREKVLTVNYSLNLKNNKLSEVLWRDDEKILITAGRLVAWKGFDFLIENLKNLPDSWKLYILGDGPDRDRLNGIVKRENLEKRVFFTGTVNKEEMIEYLSKADMFALCSAFESFSFQIAEAMYAGLPVIATKVGSFPEVVRENVDGILIPLNDKEAFLRAVEKYDKDIEFRKKVIKNAKERINHFSVDITVSELIDILKKCL